MPHDLADVSTKLTQAVQSFTTKYVAQRIGAMELRLSQKLAHAGYPRLAVAKLDVLMADLSGRVDALDRINSSRGSD